MMHHAQQTRRGAVNEHGGEDGKNEHETGANQAGASAALCPIMAGPITSCCVRQRSSAGAVSTHTTGTSLHHTSSGTR